MKNDTLRLPGQSHLYNLPYWNPLLMWAERVKQRALFSQKSFLPALCIMLLSGLLSAQHVGVNINSPAFTLDVRGEINDTGAILHLATPSDAHFLRLFSGSPAMPEPYLWWNQGYSLRFAVGDGMGNFYERMRIRSGGLVGINQTIPISPLHVHAPAGISLPAGNAIIYGAYDDTTVTPADVVAVKGYSRPANFFGIGGEFEGGWIGASGKVLATGPGYFYGAMGHAEGTEGTKHGIYGSASGGGVNWAGFFDQGNVYINNRLGIGQDNPAWPIDIEALQAVVRMVSSFNTNGSVLELKNLTTSPNFLGAINFNNAASTFPGQIAYTGSNHLLFKSNGQEQFRVDNNGHFGIGTNAPESWVDILRNSTAAIPHLTLRESDVDYARMNFKIGALPFEWSLKAFSSGVSEDADFLIQYVGQTISGTRMRIRGSGQVTIPAGVDASYTSDGYLQTGPGTGMNIVMDNNELLARNNGNASPLFLQRDGGDLVLCELENGRVQIGGTPAGLPTDPDYLLAIGGKAICEELKVELQGTWPDYVFREDYSLIPLMELEERIRQQGHLPGMPAAAQVENDGIEVGEMQRLLLEKIEELTLYVIELKKENIEQAKEIKVLNTKRQ